MVSIERTAQNGRDEQQERNATNAGLLARVPLFTDLPESELRVLAESCRSRRFKAGEALFHEEDPGTGLFLLRSGRVSIVRIAPSGAETMLHIYRPGEGLGEMALVDGGPRSATAVALEPVEALFLHRDEFLALLERRPQVALAVLQKVSGLVRRLNEQVQALLSLDVPGRLAHKLLELADAHGEPSPHGLRIGVRITQEQFAQMVGATRPTVNQELRSFQERGLLSIDREGITLHQPDQLRKRIY